ncbi:MAG: phosphopantetheine-binding protein [Actinocatenispora sp.]
MTNDTDAPEPLATDAGSAELLGIIGVVVGRLAPTPVASADPDRRLIEDLGYHSLALVELTFLLEELFSLEQTEADRAANIRTVADVAGYIAEVRDPGQPLPSDEHVAGLLEDFVAPAES